MTLQKKSISDRYNDSYFAATDGRNDIRRENINETVRVFTDQARDEERERIKDIIKRCSPEVYYSTISEINELHKRQDEILRGK